MDFVVRCVAGFLEVPPDKLANGLVCDKLVGRELRLYFHPLERMQIDLQNAFCDAVYLCLYRV